MEQKKRITIWNIMALQGAVVIYTMSGIFAKFSSNYEVMSRGFLMFVALEILALGIYAIILQQVIKKFPLSVAYANRATSIFWSMIWAFFLFKEKITVKNLIGVAIIFVGVLLVNMDEV